MNSGSDTSDLGPLPISDEKAELQRESIKALNALLKGQDDIIFRDERIEDYGVDGSFELKLVRRMTNFRGQVQMKAAGSLSPLFDGSFSHSVRTANLNYLLNGTAPIYILYDLQKDEFWFTWAQDESRRLNEKNSNWRKQEWIALNFTERFTPASLPDIHARIMKEGRLHRQIHDSLAKATGSEAVVLSIDSESLSITDPIQARDVLLASGAAIVAGGFPVEVLDLMRLLDAEIRETARIQLTAGYAEFTRGDHYSAIGHIRRALARKSELSARDQSFLVTLRDAAEFHVGLIDTEAYQQRLTARSKTLEGLEALEARQDALHHQYLGEKDGDSRAAIVEKLREVTAEILSHSDAHRGIKLDARLLLLFLEGMQANMQTDETLFYAEIREFLYPGDTKSATENLQNARCNQLGREQQTDEALREAYDLRHPVLIVQALIVTLYVRVGRLFEKRMEAITSHQSYKVPEPAKTSIENIFNEAYRLSRSSGLVEGRLTLDKLKIRFLEVEGDIGGAKAAAEMLCPEADAMGFKMIAEEAREVLEDRTLLMRYEQDIAKSDLQHRDQLQAVQTDEQLSRLAKHLLKIIGSPPAHPKKFLGYMRSLRFIAQERCGWCRHLQLWEDLTQTIDPATAFSVSPMRKVICDKFNHISSRESVDVVVIIEDIKRDFCHSCSARDPRGY
jgi:hypothetical protein